ncbi:hypothetical protein SCHPADRAFT_820169 [Schizopora paradoxa]|uniref:Methyltransferase type 11 domain-containing protein n=1 Tax=Schizopora paradoxa TaxID=27342 RepID=A0A0H2S1P0_9AGAM|nr:hypothetical protein SCHPADRAFT_820169 [Schizopora paradoxa]
MATFSKVGFSVDKYAIARPTYPRQLFDSIFRYHELGPQGENAAPMEGKPRWDVAVDLGCGTGQATVELHPFKRIVGVDPSQKMLESARKYADTFVSEEGKSNPSEGNQFGFVQSAAEELGFLKDGSVDLVVSAQAAHWFDWNRLWPELSRVLRKNATVAFWGYSDFRLTRYPSLSPTITQYMQGTDPANSLGCHWEPGRAVINNHLRSIPSAASVVPNAFFGEQRLYYTGSYYPSLPSPLPVILRKKVSWDGFYAYLQSFSSLHTFHERYPEDLKHPEGSIAQRFMETLKTEMKKADEAKSDSTEDSESSANTTADDVDKEEEVEIEWPLALVLVKRT